MKNITVDILAEITQDSGEQQKIDMTTEGSYYQRSGAYYITYDESEISGMEGSRTVIKIKNNQVTLTRMGPSHSKMIFDTTQAYNGIYHTPYGDFDMRIHTEVLDIDFDFEHGSGQVLMHYDMVLQAMSQSKNMMTIRVRPSHG